MKNRLIELAIKNGYQPVFFTRTAIPKKKVIDVSHGERIRLERELIKNYLQTKMGCYVEITYRDGYFDVSLKWIRDKGVVFKQFSGYSTHDAALEEGCKMLCI